MRKGVTGWTRRFAAAVGVSLVTLVVTGPGAGAASTAKIVNYVAEGSAQVLDLSLDIPALADVLNSLDAVGISNPITEKISFSNAYAQIDRLGDKGTGLGQMFQGTLDPVLETVANALPGRAGKGLPRVFATLGEALKHDDLLAVDLPSKAASIVHVGVSEVNAVSALTPLAEGLRVIESKSDSKLIGVRVDLGSALASQLKGLLDPVLEITDGAGGLIDTINGGLDSVEDVVQDTLDIDVNLNLPKVADLLNQPLLTVGLIETGSATGYAGIARSARGFSKMVDVNVFGEGDNALVHIDSLETQTVASIDGTTGGAVAKAVQKIVGLRILGNQIDLTKDLLTINGKQFKLPTDAVLSLKDLLTTLGLDIQVFNTEEKAGALESSASANTLKITLAPLDLFVLTVKGPGSQAMVAGSGVKGAEFPRPTPRTGVADTAYLLAGPALLGMAILVRKYVVSH